MRVHLVQPVVPHYRVEFLNRLNAALHGRLALWAAPRVPGLPPSVDASQLPGLEANLNCAARSLLGGRLLFQVELDQLFAQDPDVVVICGNPRHLHNLPIIRKARRAGVGIVWWGHAASSTSTRLGTAIRYRLMTFADAILVYTDAERSRLIDFGFAADRVFFANNALPHEAIDRARRGVTKAGLTEWRARLGLAEGDEVVVFCGRLTEKADLPLLVAAMSQMAAHHPHLLALIIGDGKERAALQASIASQGLDRHFSFVFSVHDDAALAHLFELADCFVYPGEVGLSLLHALYHGVPAVIHDDRRRHNPEADAFVEDLNGVSFHRGNPEALAVTLSELLRDRDRLQRLKSAARGSVVPRFTIDTMVNGFLAACSFARSRAQSRQERRL